MSREIRDQRRKYGYGSESYHSKDKKLGLGVGPGFVGGMGYNYAATLATYSLYHRYLWLQRALHDAGYESRWDEEYHHQYYER